MATWAAFSYSSSEWNNVDDTVRVAYEELSTGSGLSARDLFTRAYLKGLYREPNP